jgi:hypothetical protein
MRDCSAEKLVGIWGHLNDDAAVLAVHATVGRAAGAAAGAEYPEQNAAQEEEDSEPSSNIEGLTHVGHHTVKLDGFVEGSLFDREEHP